MHYTQTLTTKEDLLRWRYEHGLDDSCEDCCSLRYPCVINWNFDGITGWYEIKEDKERKYISFTKDELLILSRLLDKPYKDLTSLVEALSELKEEFDREIKGK
jgi:hypothetical protein